PADTHRRAGPLSFFALAVLVASLGAISYVIETRTSALHELALSAPPPVQQSITSFDEARDAGFAREVSIRAQVDFTSKVELGLNGILGTPQYTLLSLLAEDASGTAPSQRPGVLILDGPIASFDEARLDRLMANIVDMGTFGPILELQGKAGGVAPLNPLFRYMLGNEGQTLSDPALFLRPFEAGREAAFAPRPVGASLILAGGIAAVFAVIGALLMAFRSNHRPVAVQVAPVAVTGDHYEIAPYDPEMVTGEDGRGVLEQLLAQSRPLGQAATTEIYSPGGQQETMAAYVEDEDDLLDDDYDYRSEIEDLFGDSKEAQHLYAALDVPKEAQPSREVQPAREAAPVRSEQPVRDLELTATTHAYGDDPSVTDEMIEEQLTGEAPKKAPRFGGLKLGTSVRKDVKLSRREEAKLKSDPFAQRLAKMG
ncbi:MAG: hypothetical protein AAFY03_02575, partial [Pseudomonadota bacterium]